MEKHITEQLNWPEEKTITVWITKYALTTGVYRTEGKTSSVSEDMICTKVHDNDVHYKLIFHGNEWQKSESDAKKRGEEMRIKKIKSFEKQLAKYKAMSFK